MKKALLVLLTLCAVSILGAGVYAAAQTDQNIVRHVVLLKFKDGTNPDQIKKIEQGFVNLKNQLDVVKDLEWGANISPEKLDAGFTHCFFVTFADEKGRDAYLPSKPHQDFVAILRPSVDKILVIDYKPQ